MGAEILLTRVGDEMAPIAGWLFCQTETQTCFCLTVTANLNHSSKNMCIFAYQNQQDAQLSRRDRAAVCVIVFAKSRTLELGDNDLRTL